MSAMSAMSELHAAKMDSVFDTIERAYMLHRECGESPADFVAAVVFHLQQLDRLPCTHSANEVAELFC
jgi:hypothetical protein